MPDFNDEDEILRIRLRELGVELSEPTPSHLSFTINLANNEPSQWKTILVQETPPKEKPMTNEVQVQETITDEFIKSYFNSEEWIIRMHKHLDVCAYDGFRFGAGKSQDEYLLKCSVTEMYFSNFLNAVYTSKHFKGKIYNLALVKECITQFLNDQGFIKVEGFSDVNEETIFFNKMKIVEAKHYKYYPASRSQVSTVALIPLNYISVCPCCTNKLYNAPSEARLCASAYSRYLEGNLDLSNEIIPGCGRTLRENVQAVLCPDCFSSHLFVKCDSCRKYEQNDYIENHPDGSGYGKTCFQCTQNIIRDRMFVHNILTFQPIELSISDKMRYVGCEFECYVKPKKRALKFNQKYVFQVKQDGSLVTPGKGIPVEVVTQPLLNWREKAIKDICKELHEADVFVDETCGGHVHVDASGFNMSRANMKRFRNLFRIYEAAFFAVCSKSRLDNSRYCAPVNTDDYDGPLDNRYVSMNLCSIHSHNTIEIRCFDGSSSHEEWLSRIAFAEGFVNFAKEKMNEMIATTDMGVLSQLASDGGYESWNGIIDTYGFTNRNSLLKNKIKENGAALINLAACKFKLKPKTISSLVAQFERNWI